MLLRGVIDERRRAGERAGHFLLLGSAHRLHLQQSSESLAGRVAYLDLGPIDALEAKSAGYASLDQLWVRGRRNAPARSNASSIASVSADVAPAHASFDATMRPA